MSYGHNKTTKKKKGWAVKESALKDNPNIFERVDLNPESFDRLIQQKGVNAKIYRTTYCPKVKSVDGAEHEIDCNLCNGSGFIDLDPICSPVFIQTQKLESLPNVEGIVDGNTILITFPIGVEMQYFTKIELEDFTDIYIQRLMRTPGSLVDVLKYKACRVNVLIDYDGIRYYQDQDFRLDLSGNIAWLTTGDQQRVQFSETPTSGTWNLASSGFDVTEDLNFDATAAQVQSALRDLPRFGEVTVSGNMTTGFLITFVGVDSPVSLITATSDLLAGTAPVMIQVTNSSKAAKKPNDGKPYSLHYECAVQYRARLAAHSNRFTQILSQGKAEHIKLPEQWYCTKEFLVKRVDIQGNELQQGPYDRHVITGEDAGE